MEALTLVVSDPPHSRVDHQAVADALGLELANTTLKVGFSAPEVLRSTDSKRALPFAHMLTDAGLRVSVIDGRDLAAVPWPAPLSTVAFGRDGLIGEFREQVLKIEYDEPVLAVFCKPPLNYTRPPAIPELTPTTEGVGIAEAIDGMSILDLYVKRNGAIERLSIAQDVVDFAGLGDLRAGSAGDSMKALLGECGRRFTRMTVDARLENVRPRRRFVAGDAGFDMDMRKHYSFGTLLLRHALGEISPELKDLPHYEFGSRLACALGKSKLE